MNLVKNFFDDDSVIVGLTSFKIFKKNYTNTASIEPIFFNPFESNRIFETNIDSNVFLKV